MEDQFLSLALRYKMSKLEAQSLQVAIIFSKLYQKHFPSERQYALSMSKDPRKTFLFRNCRKLVKETYGTGLDYKLYLEAQFQVLSKIKVGEAHALVSPTSIVGPKAWQRWLLWQNRFKKTLMNPVQEKEQCVTHIDTCDHDLETTRQFLMRKWGEYTLENVKMGCSSGTLMRWCALGLISPYFLKCSPTVQHYLSKVDLLKDYVIDLSLYPINDRVRFAFRQQFPEEGT